MTTIKEDYIKTLSDSTLILFELADMTVKYTEAECNVWLVKGNALSEMLIRSIREYFTSEYDEIVKDATKALKDVQKKLEEELKFQKDFAATVQAVANAIKVAEQILIIFAGFRLKFRVVDADSTLLRWPI